MEFQTLIRPLPSWNDSPAKQAIVPFVKDSTTPGSTKFVLPAERIATVQCLAGRRDHA
jgi:hypothetical protein